MQNLSPQGRNAVSDLSRRYNISSEAVEHMLIAVNNGSGSMAQFNCPELGGSGQWMRGGMTMVGDMFNNGLKSTVDNLCNELSNLLANTQVFPEVPAGTPGSNQWWPPELNTPISSGSQNNSRYAIFNGRLAVEVNGNVTVYDTLDHQIGGVSQQQGGNNSLTFSSQYGTVSVSSLPVVSGESVPPPPESNFAAPDHSARSTPVESAAPRYDEPMATSRENESDKYEERSNNAARSSATGASSQQSTSIESNDDIIGLIEKLAQLHNAGILNDEEFNTKKQELLARL